MSVASVSAARRQTSPHIYVVSNFGTIQFQRSVKLRQLRPADEYSILVVLYVTPSLKSFDPAYNAMSHFDKVVFVKLPFGCNLINMRVLKKIHTLYSQLLDKIRPSQMTLFSFESHYALLCRLAQERGISMTLSEEGLGSYKYLIKREERVPDPPMNWRVFLKKLGKGVVRPHLFPRWVVRYGFYNQVFHVKKIRNHPVYSTALRPWKNFDKVILCYPDVLKNFFTAGEVEQFTDSYLNDSNRAATQDTASHYAINNGSAIYISQRVPGIISEDTFPAVLGILRQMAHAHGWQEVLIKLHPKEIEESATLFREAVAGDPLFKIIEDYPFPAECLIEYARPAQVISIGSVTLVYGYNLSPQTQFISILPLLEAQMNLRKLQTYASQRFFHDVKQIFSLFPHIRFQNEEAHP